MRRSDAIDDKAAADGARHEALWLEAGQDGVRPLLDLIGDTRVVLIGEATHGTHEFYKTRADTAALIRDKQFNIVEVEADWPDAYRVNRWVRLACDESGPAAALDDFVRFPRWMWRKEVVVDFNFRARLAEQFDAVIHVDTTAALTPLERWSCKSSDLPETYPTGA